MGSSTGKPRIAVVGGGLAGAFTAYHLARIGASPTLIERDEVGMHASGNNPGGLNPLHGPGIPGPMQELALASFRLHLESWDTIRRLSGIEFSPGPARRLHVAVNDEDVTALERTKAVYDGTAGFSAEWIQAERALAAEPRLTPAIVLGLGTEGNARVDPRPYARAIAKAAVRLGATLVIGEARGLRRRGSRQTGVLLDTGSINFDGVVIASGPWCEGPADWLETPIPVAPLKGDMLLVRGTGGGVEPSLAWRDGAAYASGGDAVWLGGSEESVGFDSAPSTAARAAILDRARRVLPGLGDPHVLRQTTALRPVTPDGCPIVGPAPGWENAYLAVGGGRKGVLLSAGMGLAAAELVMTGETVMPIQSCGAGRWVAAAVG